MMKIELTDEQSATRHPVVAVERDRADYFQRRAESLRKDVGRLSEQLKERENELEALKAAQSARSIVEQDRVQIVVALKRKVNRLIEKKKNLQRDKCELINQLKAERETNEKSRLKISGGQEKNKKLKQDLSSFNDSYASRLREIKSCLESIKTDLKPQEACNKLCNQRMASLLENSSLEQLKTAQDFLLKSVLKLIDNSKNITELATNFGQLMDKGQTSPSSVTGCTEASQLTSALNNHTLPSPSSLAKLYVELEYLRHETCSSQHLIKTFESQLAERDDQIIVLQNKIDAMEKDKETKRSEIARLFGEFLK